MMKDYPYWLDTAEPITGILKKPKDGGILVIGSGFAGCSVAGYLAREGQTVQMVDAGIENASFYRNAGHILLGAGEAYKTVVATKGEKKALQLYNLSASFCKMTKDFVTNPFHGFDHMQGNYYCIAIDDQEAKVLKESVKMLEPHFYLSYIYQKEHKRTRCYLSAHGNPVQFRNALLKKFDYWSKKDKYFSYEVKSIEEKDSSVIVTYKTGETSTHDAVVNCTNAYAPLLNAQIKNKIIPFRGQIIVSERLPFPMEKFSFSSDHGSIYGQITHDNRLLIGGWRNKVEGKEQGDYKLVSNPQITEGLINFAKERLPVPDSLKYEYCWTGIMGSARGALPLVGPVPGHSLVYTCSGFTGYGFGWGFGCGKICADIILGNEIPEIAYEFRP